MMQYSSDGHKNHNMVGDDDSASPIMSFSSVPQIPKSLDVPDPSVMNTLAAKELNSMTVNQRELVFEDIHGVSALTNETPDIVEKNLYALHQALDRITNKAAYDLAVSQSPTFARGYNLLMQFLRSTCFDAKQAASKIVRFFEYKRLYFGDALLGRPIQFQDLTAEDLDVLRSGWVQILPFRDKSGRTVMCFVAGDPPKNKSAMNVIRAFWFFKSLLVQDEETQKSGLVSFVLGRDKTNLSSRSREISWNISIMGTYFPFRLMCCHLCIESNLAGPLASLARLGANKEIRARFRIHGGTQLEWMYTLMTFGIPADYVPLTNGGNLKVKFHRQWIAHKQATESMFLQSWNDGRTVPPPTAKAPPKKSQRKIIDLPRRHDILLGKGSMQQKYYGNQLFQQIIQENCERYVSTSSRRTRMAIAREVLVLLRNENARFLERHEDGCFWVELLEEQTILSKIAYQLRTKKPIPKSANMSTPYDNNRSNNGLQDYVEHDHEPASVFLQQSGCATACCGPVAKRAKFHQ